MPAYLSKSRDQILRNALAKLSERSSITATGPGSIARALVEVVTDDLGDFYSILDFNMSQSVISTATGRSLELIGQLYNVERKQVSDLAATEASVGAFYFYIDHPHTSTIVIPRGVRVSTAENDELGNTFVYGTTEDVLITPGRLRGYVGIRPLFPEAIFTAGANTLTEHDYVDAPPGVTVRCTNPKAIAPQLGYEGDDDYRVRIIKSIRTAAGGTAEAIRFAALAIPGVRDIRVRQAPYGLGTFEVLVTSEDYNNAVGLTTFVQSVLELTRPVGVRMMVRQPTLMHLDVDAVVTLTPGSRISDAGIVRRVENAILRYLNTLLVGDPMVYNQMVSYVLETAEVISDVTIMRLAVNGQEVLRKNYTPQSDEHLVPGSIDVSVA